MWPTFDETLPAGLDGLPESNGASADGATPQPRILLVDDDAFMLGMHARMLRHMGFAMIGTAPSASAALGTLSRSAVDVIVCDLNMPGGDGIELLQNVKGFGFSGSVILLSGEGQRIMHSVRRLLGGTITVLGALVKPARQADFRQLLETWRPLGAAAPSRRPAVGICEAELRAANRRGEWVLHYQPKVDLATASVIGYEALVRWNHPGHGLLYPDSFIDLAETTGAIEGLTDWVLGAAIRQLSRWLSEGAATQLAVNVSMDNMSSPSFVKRLCAMTQQAAVSPQNITLEVTESRVMESSSVPLENLVRLRMHRFGLSIDDFGTGHSSLAQLRDVPFTELKIDRGFVSGARHNQIIRPMLEGSVGLAKRMDMHSVAEGVEAEDDWDLLREIGCDSAQGWFIGAAMPVERIPSWMNEWAAKRPASV